jgi:hypothetical protein
MTAPTQNRGGEILNAEFFRAQAQTCRIQLMHTPLRERRYELQARADLYALPFTTHNSATDGENGACEGKTGLLPSAAELVRNPIRS